MEIPLAERATQCEGKITEPPLSLPGEFPMQRSQEDAFSRLVFDL
jgi:hypothetical protein